MALRAVIDHPKFFRLKNVLRLNKSCTLGYLEALWHFCGRYTPQGNLGKYSNDEIEAWLEWDGEPGALISAFINAKWVDINETHRLIVHDWHNHADDATRKALGRAKLGFVSTCPDTVGTQSQESLPPEGLPGAGAGAEPEPEPGAEPGRETPSPSTVGPKLVRPQASGPTDEETQRFADWCEHRYAKHPKKRDKMISMKSLQERFSRDPAARELFERHHDMHCETDAWREKSGSFAPKLWEFVENDGWKYPPIQPSKQDSPGRAMKWKL